MPAEEAQLVHPEVAQPGHAPLVEQRRVDRPGRVGRQPGDRGLRVPVLAQRVGPEVSDHLVLVRRWGSARPSGSAVRTRWARPRRPAAPGCRDPASAAAPCPVGPPSTTRPSADGCAASARCRSGSAGACRGCRARARWPDQVGADQRGDPQLTAYERAALQRRVELACLLVDAVAFRHRPIIPRRLLEKLPTDCRFRARKLRSVGSSRGRSREGQLSGTDRRRAVRNRSTSCPVVVASWGSLSSRHRPVKRGNRMASPDSACS